MGSRTCVRVQGFRETYDPTTRWMLYHHKACGPPLHCSPRTGSHPNRTNSGPPTTFSGRQAIEQLSDPRPPTPDPRCAFLPFYFFRIARQSFKTKRETIMKIEFPLWNILEQSSNF